MFKYLLLLCAILFVLLVFFLSTSPHISWVNAVKGPYHLNSQGFKKHLENFKNGDQLWLERREYVQVEIGENNIQNPASSFETIRCYTNPVTRRPNQHIATFKTLKNSRIYVKLPTRFVSYIHTRFPFDFSRFSVKTLKCIYKVLTKSAGNRGTFVEKSDYLEFIKNEYSKNSTAFNMAVLTKCGILIGFLYCPLKEQAFTPTTQIHFHETDVAFDMSQPYLPNYLFIIHSIIFLIIFGLMFHCLFYLIPFCLLRLRILIHRQITFLSFPLNAAGNLTRQLRLLNLRGPIHEQLIKLDELIQGTELLPPLPTPNPRQISVIKNAGQMFVVFLPNDKMKNKKPSPFIICPVSRIRSIGYEGIMYAKFENDAVGNYYTYKWPTMASEVRINYANWLHGTLRQKSPVYLRQ